MELDDPADKETKQASRVGPATPECKAGAQADNIAVAAAAGRAMSGSDRVTHGDGDRLKPGL